MLQWKTNPPLLEDHQSEAPYKGCCGWAVNRPNEDKCRDLSLNWWSADCVCLGLQVLPLLLLLLHPSFQGSSSLITGHVFHVLFDSGLALITFLPKNGDLCSGLTSVLTQLSGLSWGSFVRFTRPVFLFEAVTKELSSCTLYLSVRRFCSLTLLVCLPVLLLKILPTLMDRSALSQETVDVVVIQTCDLISL